jgi:hypothetical protein
LAAFEKDLKDNLYKVWNRMSSGSYIPPPVRLVEIPKDNCRTALSVAPVGQDVSRLRENLAELPKRKQYDLQFRVPNTWVPWSAFQNTINVQGGRQDGLPVELARFRLPAAGDDREDVDLCFRLAEADLPARRLKERTASEYLGKWAEAFRLDPEQVNVEILKTGEITVTHFEIAGRCCGDSPVAKENQAILAAYLEASDVAWIIQGWGPRATIDAAREDFRELLPTIRR